MLRNRLVCGISNDAIQCHLLSKTLGMEISLGMEMAAGNAKDIQKQQAASQSATVHRLKKETVKATKPVECFGCGKAHYANCCKIEDTVCHTCNKNGNLAEKCRCSKNRAKQKKLKLDWLRQPHIMQKLKHQDF